jgi:tripartite-type tricarboxylate transporter receptor subunit TctC
MKQARRNQIGLVTVVGIVLLAIAATHGFAAGKYPSKTISIIVPWNPGGRTDTVARIVAPALQKAIGESVVVLNKPGSVGYIGMKAVATARPDGYTLGMGGAGLVVRQYTGVSKIRWEEYKWIGQIYTASATVSVYAESPWKTIGELIDYARKNPTKVKHGNTGRGGTTHLFSEGFANAAGIKLSQFAYKGDSRAMMAVASKEVDVGCSPLAAVRPLMEAGKIRVLALQSDKRSQQFPNIPTLKEKGINWSSGTFEGLIVTKGTPDNIVAIVERALEKAMKDPDVAKAFSKLDLVVEYRNHKDYTAYTARQDKRFKKLLQESGIIK